MMAFRVPWYAIWSANGLDGVFRGLFTSHDARRSRSAGGVCSVRCIGRGNIARRKELWEAREVSAPAEPKPQGGRPLGFAGSTSKATGVSKAKVNRAVKRGRDIAPEVLVNRLKLSQLRSAGGV